MYNCTAAPSYSKLKNTLLFFICIDTYFFLSRLPKLKEWIDKNDPGAPLIPFSGVYESKLLDMDPQEREAFIKDNVPR